MFFPPKYRNFYCSGGKRLISYDSVRARKNIAISNEAAVNIARNCCKNNAGTIVFNFYSGNINKRVVKIIEFRWNLVGVFVLFAVYNLQMTTNKVLGGANISLLKLSNVK